ncbi:MAG: flagellar basal body L-ring protein FlgH [Planctomycetia bacterium]|nr:MAG: flagellar basal body L-ring protein FlgH [Planctomycetia bacterium]
MSRIAVLCVVLNIVAQASGQSNSLFGRQRAAAARPAQPATEPSAPATPASAAPARPEAVAGNGGAGGAATAGAPSGAPVGQRAVPVAPGGIGQGRQAARPGQSAVEPSPNPDLAAVSTFAVELPQPETIQVHDFVTIIIREDKTATSDAKTTSDKKWDVQSELAKWVRLNPENRLIPQSFSDGTPAVDFNFQDKWEGTGKVNRKDSLVTRITAEVIDVKPNGNLVLEARKSIRMDEEEQVALLTGMCRSRDVSPQNTVLSTQLADVRIDIAHSGAARDAANRGWLKRAVDFLRPF